VPKTVLLIDDEPAIVTALTIRLRAAGFTAKTAQDGQAGLNEAAAQCQPDVIVLDIRMPGMDGFEVCRQLKADPNLSLIPVIFLSANVKDEAKKTAYEVGGAAFLSKPYDAADVLAKINQVLAARAPNK